MTKTITAVIIDDEIAASELLAAAILQVSSKIYIKDIFSKWTEALQALSENSYDIIFLDIDMGTKTGFDLLKAIPNKNAELIFVTAHPDFALDAFKFRAAGYLLKPVDVSELAQLLHELLKRIHSHKEHSEKSKSAQIDKIGIPTQNIIRYVSVADILYLEALSAYTRVVTKNEELVCSYSIGRFNSLLDPRAFFSIHRSFTINLHYVQSYDTRGTVRLTDGKELPVAKANRLAFQNLFSRVGPLL